MLTSAALILQVLLFLLPLHAIAAPHYGAANLRVHIHRVVRNFRLEKAPKPATQVRIVAVYPHNTSAFTEGLFYEADGDCLVESTGLTAQSFVRRYPIRSTPSATAQQARSEFAFDRAVFGEGIASLNDKIYALTYTQQQILLLDHATLELVDTFPLQTTTGEGWGMTTDGSELIASDGSSTLLFIDPRNNAFTKTRSIQVQRNGVPVLDVNELEYVNGEILANVWFQNCILRIDPATGDVLETIDLSWIPSMVKNIPALPLNDRDQAVMNGIAYDPKTRHIFLTGKFWDSIFELELSYLA